MQVQPDQYVFPPRSKDAIPRADTEIFGMLGWVAQLKYNDSHALIKYCQNGAIELWNRHAERFRTYHAPSELIEQLDELGATLGIKPGTVTILDGGLLDQKHVAIKDTIVIWDILVFNNKHLIGTTYNERYQQVLDISSLETPERYLYENKSHEPIPLGYKFTPDILIPQCWEPCDWDNCWDLIATVNAPYTTGTPGSPNYDCKPVIEGLVFKDPNGVLELGFKESNNDSWMMRSRVMTGRHRF